MDESVLRIVRQLGTAGGSENAEMICSLVSDLFNREREGFTREREGFEREREGFEREREGSNRERGSLIEGSNRERGGLIEGFEREREGLKREFEAAEMASKRAAEAAEMASKRAAEAALELSLREKEALQTVTDRELGLIGTRSILERIALEIGPKKSCTASISDLFTQKDTKFFAYLCQVAFSRQVKVYDIAEAGKNVYSDLSSRVHHGVADQDHYEADTLPLPTNSVLALGAVFKFHRRNPSFVRQGLPSPKVTPPASASASASASPEKIMDASSSSASSSGSSTALVGGGGSTSEPSA